LIWTMMIALSSSCVCSMSWMQSFLFCFTVYDNVRFAVKTSVLGAFTRIFVKRDWVVLKIALKNGVSTLSARTFKVFKAIFKHVVLFCKRVWVVVGWGAISSRSFWGVAILLSLPTDDHLSHLGIFSVRSRHLLRKFSLVAGSKFVGIWPKPSYQGPRHTLARRKKDLSSPRLQPGTKFQVKCCRAVSSELRPNGSRNDIIFIISGKITPN
jgi:hypothetical protein